MDYQTLVGVYQKLESTSKRLEKTRIISEFIRELETDDLKSVLLLLQGRVFPRWDETNLGIASKIVVKAIGTATGLTLNAIEQEWKKTGDLGITAQNVVERKTQSTLFSESLTVDKVFNNLRKMPTLEGLGSIERKISLISELLTSALPEESRYIVRTILEDLRVGVGEGSLRDAIVWAYFSKEIDIKLEEGKLVVEDRENYNKYVEAVQQAYDIMNDFYCFVKKFLDFIS